MHYTCSNCGRTLNLGEELSFCPFCGNSYHGAAQAISTTRIVIGSDSKKTIQEKYWNLARESVQHTLNRLKKSLPRFSEKRNQKMIWSKSMCDRYKREPLDVQELSELEHSASTAVFQAKMRRILENMEKAYRTSSALLELGNSYIEEDRKISSERAAAMECGEWSIEEIEDEYSINIAAEEAFVQEFCAELAENLGNMSPDRLRPELDYDPDSLEWLQDEDEDEDEASLQDECFAHFAEYGVLWTAIQNAAAVVIDVLQSNGLFALTMVHGEASENFNPKQCARDIQTLKNNDYDPLFGESPECFIQTFFDGLANLMAFINAFPDYIDVMQLSPEQKLLDMKNALDEIKLNALRRLIVCWSDILTQELDRLYQSQNEDMMDVCGRIDGLSNSLDEKK